MGAGIFSLFLDAGYFRAQAWFMEVNLSPELQARLAHIAAENNSGRVPHLRSVFRC